MKTSPTISIAVITFWPSSAASCRPRRAAGSLRRAAHRAGIYPTRRACAESGAPRARSSAIPSPRRSRSRPRASPSPGAPSARGLRAARDQLGELADRLDVAELRDPHEPVRVEVVAEQSATSGPARAKRRGRRSARGSPRRSSRARARTARRRAARRPALARLRRSASPRAGSRARPRAIVCQRHRNGLHRPVDLLVAVRERDEHRLELRRGDVDAALDEPAEERVVGVPAARKSVSIAPTRCTVAERRRPLLERAARASSSSYTAGRAGAAAPTARRRSQRVPRERPAW